ncbi:DUF2937 family protein [Histidinibacterium lentulum]|uniref:DUF2937 family protein n=1 Tax=Histidinibacterium lentulum TaxID=2480588 RepID=A0A3N2QM75_9RHOB|nr:DUF2937 family protein [Histidinibacterium lentulum]ROT96292.1 DUF2937 family protein [Histidinibacterium lentulum]
MILRLLAMTGGLAGAAGLSQYPEFAQQYTQRLAGQVDALGAVVSDFDATAARSGLTREAALAQMTGTAFLEDRQADMGRAIRRHGTLSEALEQLEAASPMERLVMPHRMADPETFAGTWSAYVPAVPLSAPGAVSAAAGYAGGWAIAGLLGWLLAAPFRRRRHVGGPRTEPPVTRTG